MEWNELEKWEQKARDMYRLLYNTPKDIDQKGLKDIIREAMNIYLADK